MRARKITARIVALLLLLLGLGGGTLALAGSGTSSSISSAQGAYQACVAYVQANTLQSPLSANLAMGTHKITGLGNGSASTDAAAFGQLPKIQVLTSMLTAGAHTFSGLSLTGSSSAWCQNTGISGTVGGPYQVVVNSGAGTVVVTALSGTGANTADGSNIVCWVLN